MLLAKNNAPHRTASGIQSMILLITSALSVLLTAIIGPSLPQMEKHFAATPNAAYWVSLSITAPMLVMVVFSVFVGILADKVGRKRMLVWATLAYATFGMAPLWLDSLHAIIASRLCIGIAEAMLMTCSTAMIGDYFEGHRRDKFMALQTVVAAGSAVLFNMLGGALGEFGWRAPYAVYAFSLLLLPLMHIYLWEPSKTAPVTRIDEARTAEPEFRPSLLILICLLTFVGAIAFLVVPVNMGFLFHAIHEEQPGVIGLAYAVNSVGVATGAGLFAWLVGPRLRVAAQVALFAAVSALGFVLMQQAQTVLMLTVAGAVNGLGCGLLLPTLTSWNMRELPTAKRGFGTGAFMSCFYLGFFVSPLLVLFIADHLDGRASAVGGIGIAMGGLALIATVIAVLRRAVPANTSVLLREP